MNSSISIILTATSHLNYNNQILPKLHSIDDDLEHTNAIDILRSSSKYNISTNVTVNSPLSITIAEADKNDITESIEEILCENEIRYSVQFRDRETHYFILSQSGKPIFSRYGNDSQTAAFIGVMQAMISFVEAGNDTLKVMIAGNHTFVFLVRDNIILVAVSSGAYVPNQLKIVLHQIYNQIISMLTYRAIYEAFKKQPSLDLRRLLVGIDNYLHGIIDHMESDFGPILKSVNFVTMNESLRMSILNTVSQNLKINDVVFALILLDGQLIGIVCQKGYNPHPLDVHLLLNLIRNVVYFNSQICWLPVCLPRFDPDGYFYAHISYIVPGLSLVLLTVNPDQFDLLQKTHNVIRHLMIKNGLTKHLSSMTKFDMLLQSFDMSNVRHFIYKIRSLNQHISYLPNKYSSDCDPKNVVSRYLRLHHLIHHPGRQSRLVYQSTSTHTVIAWLTRRFELYATFDNMKSKDKLTEIMQTLLDAIDKNKNSFFVTVFPTFN